MPNANLKRLKSAKEFFLFFVNGKAHNLRVICVNYRSRNVNYRQWDVNAQKQRNTPPLPTPLKGAGSPLLTHLLPFLILNYTFYIVHSTLRKIPFFFCIVCKVEFSKCSGSDTFFILFVKKLMKKMLFGDL